MSRGRYEVMCHECVPETITTDHDGLCCAGLCCDAMSPLDAQDFLCGLGLPEWVTCPDCRHAEDEDHKEHDHD